MNPYADKSLSSVASDDGGGNGTDPHSFSYAAVAARLLQDNFLLTALELHTELVECGRELPQLREFFSNPGNFEQHVSRTDNMMHRTPSQGTLDSLDMTRYSEDGGVGGGVNSDVAVLEFELRKARETINALRANLTQVAECDSSDKNKERSEGGPLKPHEKRALNFLVNEYLLLQSYKLTAITFSDENPDQDFEDWDDVGLNVPRPCGLVSLYRGDLSHVTKPHKDVATATELLTVNAECQTDPMDDMMCVNCQTSLGEDIDWNQELLMQAEEILLLKRQILALETDKANYRKLYDAALASLNSLTTPVSESPGLDLAIPPERLAAKQTSLERVCDQTLMYKDNHYGSTASTNSGTPEQFEVIDCEKNDVHKYASSLDLQQQESSRSPRRGSEATLDETLSLNEAGEWTRLQHPDVAHTALTWLNSSLPSELKTALLGWCLDGSDGAVSDNDLLVELLALERSVSPNRYVSLVAETMLRIVPHTLVARRCESAALLAATAHLLSKTPGPGEPPSGSGAQQEAPSGSDATPDAARRARLLQLLLTLLKKPDPNETKIICDAVTLLVKWGGGGEVLSCIADLLSSRSAERRALAACVCVRVAPHVASDLAGSLLLSLAQLMCEAGEPEIRSMGLRTSVLICPTGEAKYAQFEAMLFAMMKDPVEQIRKDCCRVFAPVLARSAIGAGKLPDLCQKLLHQLTKYSNESDWKCIALYLNMLENMATPVLAHVMNVQIVKNNIRSIDDSKCEEISSKKVDVFLDAQCFLFDYTLEAQSLVSAMNKLVKETSTVRWKELEWFLDKIIKQLLDISMASKLLNHPPTYHIFIHTFYTYCHTFGEDFTEALIKPILNSTATDIEKKLETLQPVNPYNVVCVGILMASVLPCSKNWEIEISACLKKWVVCISLCGLPVDILCEPLKWLTIHRPHVINYCLQCIKELSNSSERTDVRMSVATLLAELSSCSELDEACFDAHIVPAIVALLSDSDEGVRARATTSLGGVARCCVSRGLGCSARCWDALRGAAARARGGGGEAARVADALTALLSPDVPNCEEVALTVLPLLCGLCDALPLSGDLLSSLIPGLQLAIHFARPQPAFVQATLLPALRKLDRIDSPSLQQHKQAVDSLIASLEPAAPRVGSPAHAPDTVGRRVTQMFQHSKTNIPNIFKKKS